MHRADHESVCGQRFDLYMSDKVLRPLNLDAGFNWSGVSQKARDRAAALYRKGVDEEHFVSDGPWIAQQDQSPPLSPTIAVKRTPQAQDLPIESYHLGSNGFVFSPQGGLRASALDLLTIGRMLVGGGALNGRRILKPETVALMQTPVWRYDPEKPNGEPYGGGAILAYGLGTRVLTASDSSSGDNLFPGCLGWVGHVGEAYGLLSGLWIDPKSGRALSYIINGVSSASHNRGTRSAFSWQEERIAAYLAKT